MPRIPDEEIQRLKRQVSIVRLCERYGIELKPQGKNLAGFCPWHKEDKPSFIVTPDKNLWHCMGACDAGGDVFSLVMKAESVSFRQAAEILLEISGSIPASATVQTRSGAEHPILVKPEDDLSEPELLNHVTDFYHRAFLNDPKAMQYLEKRCCLHPEAVKRFKIGYANRTLGYRIPNTTADGQRLKQRLKALGIFRKSGHEHLSGSVVFPIFDIEGRPVQMYGRKITAGLRKGTPEHLYLEGPLKGIWNAEGIMHQKTWILCEAIIDALTLWTHGVRNVTCCFGKNTFTGDLWALMRKACPERVVIAFDNDAAGNQAAEKLAPKLAGQGVNVHRVKVPRGKDINEYVCALMQKDPKAAAHAIEGLLTDAPIICRAEQGKGQAPIALVSSDNTSSSLAANLAAKEKTAVKENENPGPEDLPEQGPSAGLPIPEPAGVDVAAVRQGEDVRINIGDRSYRVRGLAKNQTFDVMKVNLRVMAGSAFHVDSLDLYNARHRTTFINTAAAELELKPETIKKDLGKVLLKLEELQDERINQALEPKEKTPVMTESERKEALALLKSPNLLERILDDFDTWGLVGERTNKLTGFLAAVSRKLDKPLAVVVQSASASGKSTLMDAVLAMMPEEDRVQYSAMTGQSLFYFGNKDLKYKILAIVEEEGARHASYALKLLQSEGKLTIASTGKDATTGQMVTRQYKVEGPVMIFTTTTAIDIDEELLNRCIILSVDESREQTRAIHKAQRCAETLEGLVKKLEKKDVLRVQRNAQRLLAPVEVINPYAGQLTFLDDQTRTRRDHKKYLTLIRAIAFLHQYQRPVKVLKHGALPVKYVEATVEDIAVANELAHEVLGRSLDELPPQSRRFLDLVYEMVQAQCREKQIDQTDYRFTQRQVRSHTGWSDYQVKAHLRKLVSLEYVLVHHGGRGQRFVYELLYSGQGKDGNRFLMGLIDVVKLKQKHTYDGDREHAKQGREVSGSIQGAAGEHGGSIGKNAALPNNDNVLSQKSAKRAENAYLGDNLKPSYRNHSSSLAALEN
jgi:DNA primase